MARKVVYLSYYSLMNCSILYGEVKREVFLGINRSTFLFRRVKWQLVNLWSIPFKRKKIV